MSRRYPVVASLYALVFLAVVCGIRAQPYDLAKIHAMPKRTIICDHLGEEIGRIHGEKTIGGSTPRSTRTRFSKPTCNPHFPALRSVPLALVEEKPILRSKVTPWWGYLSSNQPTRRLEAS